MIAKMQVESEKVRQMVEHNLPALKNALEENGVKLDKLDVSVGQETHDFFNRELAEKARHVRGIIRMQSGQSGELTPETGVIHGI